MMTRLARYALIAALFATALALLISALPAHATTNPATPHAWIKHAEHDAERALRRISPFCARKGMSAEAWAEVNSTQPHGYEVLAECV